MRKVNTGAWERKAVTILVIFIGIILNESITLAENILMYGYNRYKLNIRQEMSIKSKWIDQYPEYSQIIILEDLGEWYRVEKGYVKKEFVFETIDIYEYGKIICDSLVYSEPNSESKVIADVYIGDESTFVRKENGFLELETGGFIEEKNVSFDFSIDYDYNNKAIGKEDMEHWKMSYLPIRYLGTLKERVAGQGVTTSKQLYFKNVIPIYEIIEGEAYFPSGQNIYKISIDNFCDFESIGEDCDILATYRTVYYTSSSSRKHNIELISRILDGTIINSGETFSYNDISGPRSAARGYREAPVIEYGGYAMDYGGGICQVSSTIYAAIMNQKHFEIIEREAHGLDVSYLPFGMDATVSYGAIDLKFINRYPYSVRLNVKSEDGVCLVTINKIK